MPNAAAFGQAKLKAVSDLLPSHKLTIEDNSGTRFRFDDSKRVFAVMLDKVFNTDCETLLARLSSSDLRRWERLIEIYLRTGYVDVGDIAWRVVSTETVTPEQPPRDLPFWIALKAVLTQNHQTYFSRAPAVEHDLVLNILCNGAGRPLSHLTRLHVLSYMRRERTAHFADLKMRYAKTMTLPGTREEPVLETAVRHAIRRLLNCRLIRSAAFLRLEEDNQADLLKEIEVTPLGIYYFDVLSQLFEYLMFMKDDIYFPQDIGLKVCSRHSGALEQYRALRTYLAFLFDQETDLFHNLKQTNRAAYRRFFAPDEQHLYYSLIYARAMCGFGEAREGLRGVAAEFKELAGKIALSERRYLEDLSGAK